MVYYSGTSCFHCFSLGLYCLMWFLCYVLDFINLLSRGSFTLLIVLHHQTGLSQSFKTSSSEYDAPPWSIHSIRALDLLKSKNYSKYFYGLFNAVYTHPSTWSPRMAVRALLLLLIATSRAVYTTLEQPRSSVMEHLPDFKATAKVIQNLLGFWQSQFLSGSQILQSKLYWSLWCNVPAICFN